MDYLSYYPSPRQSRGQGLIIEINSRSHFAWSSRFHLLYKRCGSDLDCALILVSSLDQGDKLSMFDGNDGDHILYSAVN